MKLTLKRSLDHWLAPFEITSNTSFTPNSPRCSWTRCKRDEKKPTTFENKKTLFTKVIITINVYVSMCNIPYQCFV